MIEANDGGANVSVTGGDTWTAETMPTAQFYHVITTAHVPYHICGAQQDNSTACVSSQQAQGGPGGSGGGADQVFYSVGGGESGYIANDPRNPDIFYAGSYGGPITKDNTGVETYATLFSIAPSARDANVIWTGSDDGYLQVTRDGGTTWKNVTPKDLPDFARISLVEASPFRAGTAYVAANRYQQDDFKPYVYRTDDYGATWTKIVTGVAANDFARAIREAVKVPKLLYLD